MIGTGTATGTATGISVNSKPRKSSEFPNYCH